MLLLTLVVIILANLADYVSTQYALKKNPNAREANPIVSTFGLLESKLISIGINVWLAFMMRDSMMLLITQDIIVAGLYGYIAYSNVKHAS